MMRAKQEMGLRRVAFADLGKNMLAYYEGARKAGLEAVAVVDEELGAESGRSYRGLPLVTRETFEADQCLKIDAYILTTLSPVHAQRRAAAWQRVAGGGGGSGTPVVDLFSRARRRPADELGGAQSVK